LELAFRANEAINNTDFLIVKGVRDNFFEKIKKSSESNENKGGYILWSR